MIANSLDSYFERYGKLLQQNAQSAMQPLYTPGKDTPAVVESLRKPFPKQHDLICGAIKALDDTKGIFICGTMGTGKTIMGQLTVHTHADGKPYRALVFCPGQLVKKWERELRETIPNVVVHQLEDWTDVVNIDRSEVTVPTWYVISRDRAKLGARWHGQYIYKEYDEGDPRMERAGVYCPKCGERQMLDDVPLGKGYFDKDKRYCTAETGTGFCGEPLWSYNGSIDRWEPASYIKRKLKGFFTYLVLDEIHEEKSATSAQANAAGALISACRYTVALTGTLIGGYAEHLRPLLFRMCPKSIVKEGFTWDAALPFSERYGRIETRVTEKESGGDANSMSRGRSKSTIRSVRPGIVPSLIKHLIGNTLFLSLEDVADNLPDLEETIIPVTMDSEMATHYEEMEAVLRQAIKGWTSGAKKMLGPMLNGLLNWVEHPHGWPDFGYADKDGGWTLVHRTHNFPDNYKVWPKERALIDLVKSERAQGRQCWVYVQLTDKHDMAARYQQLFQAEGLRCEVMRASVEPAKREAWIQKHCKGADVCISHPKLVETGLDLFDKKGNHNFSTLIFAATGYSLFTMRQAARRSWRIGQHLPCKVYYMFYEKTMQERALTLMGRKLLAAEAIEGKFSSDGLAALAGEDESLELALAKSLAEGAQDMEATKVWKAPPAVAALPPAPVTLPAVATPARPLAGSLSAKLAVLKAFLARKL